MTCIISVHCSTVLIVIFGIVLINTNYSLKLRPNFQDDTYDRNFYKVCKKENYVCQNDKMGFEAISLLHSQIDADKDGDLEQSESQDFLQEDLQRDAQLVGHSSYHVNDNHVSVHDLWDYWIQSEVYNWTVDEVIRWLDVNVGLSQYSQQFRIYDINGKLLPRLASSVHSPLFGLLGIRNAIHRQKISLKAADVVLFGVPKASQHSIFPDVIFASSLFLAIAGVCIGLRKHKQVKKMMAKLNFDLAMLQHAEDSLKKFQMKLDKSLKRRRVEEDERDELVRRLRNKRELNKTQAQNDTDDNNFGRFDNWDGDDDEDDDVDYSDDDDDGEGGGGGGGDDTLVNNVTLLYEELYQKKMELLETEQLLEERKKASMQPLLQQWLQLTYEMETRAFEGKRAEVERKLKETRQVCEKIKKQRFKMFGSLKQNPTEDETDHVKIQLDELKQEMEDRCLRWKEIERLTSYNIITNPGVSYLNSLLRGSRVPLDPPVNSQLSRSSTASSYLSTYPIMSNLLKVGMQLSAVGVNSNVIQPTSNHPHPHLASHMFRDDSHASLPATFSHSSVKSLHFNPALDPTAAHGFHGNSNLKGELTHSKTHGNLFQHQHHNHHHHGGGCVGGYLNPGVTSNVNPLFYISDSSPSLIPDDPPPTSSFQPPIRNIFNDFIVGRNVKTGDRRGRKKNCDLVINENPLVEEMGDDNDDDDGGGSRDGRVSRDGLGSNKSVNKPSLASNTPRRKNKLAKILDRTLNNMKNSK